MGSNQWKRFHSPLTSVTSLVPMSLSFLPLASSVPEEQSKASPGTLLLGREGRLKTRWLGCSCASSGSSVSGRTESIGSGERGLLHGGSQPRWMPEVTGRVTNPALPLYRAGG